MNALRKKMKIKNQKSKIKNRTIPFQTIIETVSDYFQIDEDIIASSSRRQEIVRARQLAIYFTKRLTNLTLKRIGAHLGGRNHSTIAYSLRMVSERIEIDRHFNGIVCELEEKVGGW